MEKLISARIQASAKAAIKAKLKDKAETKKEDEQKIVELDDDGFKIPQGTAHRKKKKIEADEHRKIVERVLQRKLDPSSYLVDIVKVRHKLLPYVFSDREWRCYLLYLVNQYPK